MRTLLFVLAAISAVGLADASHLTVAPLQGPILADSAQALLAPLLGNPAEPVPDAIVVVDPLCAFDGSHCLAISAESPQPVPKLFVIVDPPCAFDGTYCVEATAPTQSPQAQGASPQEATLASGAQPQPASQATAQPQESQATSGSAQANGA